MSLQTESYSLSTSTNCSSASTPRFKQKKKNKKTIWVRQFQSFENSFGQAFERERMYLFCNKGQAIQLLEANFDGVAKQLQMYI